MHQELVFTLKFNIPSVITQPIHLLGWKLKEEEGRGCRSQKRRRERRKKDRQNPSYSSFPYTSTKSENRQFIEVLSKDRCQEFKSPLITSQTAFQNQLCRGAFIGCQLEKFLYLESVVSPHHLNNPINESNESG